MHTNYVLTAALTAVKVNDSARFIESIHQNIFDTKPKYEIRPATKSYHMYGVHNDA